MSRPSDTRAVRRTLELHGTWSRGVLRGAVQRAFASRGLVRVEGRLWSVERFEPSTEAGCVVWTALLVNTEAGR